MNESTKASFKWRGEIGPAFIVLLFQTVGAIIAITMIYSSLTNTVSNTKDTADKLQVIVSKVQEKNSEQANRLTRVETTVDDIKAGVSKLSDKIDILTRTRP